MKFQVLALSAASAFLLTGYASKSKKQTTTAATAAAPAKFVKGILADSKGMTLYTFDKDTADSGKSVCNDGCIQAWPALTATADAKETGDFKVITRDDGSKQWAHKGKPLYYWVNDKKAGDTTGDKFNGVWHIVKEK
ncbi:MAG: hypothetical protein RLZZ488_2245 [Pseudomonadota bacterium]|jgi:predicted lipoprotein with Yx(FWY)xxD motif